MGIKKKGIYIKGAYIEKGVDTGHIRHDCLTRSSKGKSKKRNAVGVIDGLSPKDIQKVRTAIRKVWHWSYPRKLCVKRCERADGFSYCEKCGLKAPKIFIDHIEAVGVLDGGFIKRLFVSSEGLQGLCRACHQAKTNQERRNSKKSATAVLDDVGDFY